MDNLAEKKVNKCPGHYIMFVYNWDRSVRYIQSSGVSAIQGFLMY